MQSEWRGTERTCRLGAPGRSGAALKNVIVRWMGSSARVSSSRVGLRGERAFTTKSPRSTRRVCPFPSRRSTIGKSSSNIAVRHRDYDCRGAIPVDRYVRRYTRTCKSTVSLRQMSTVAILEALRALIISTVLDSFPRGNKIAASPFSFAK